MHATEAADTAAQRYRKDKQDADQKAVTDHQAEVAAEARAQKDREAIYPTPTLSAVLSKSWWRIALVSLPVWASIAIVALRSL
ncbi:hypothetical protein M405DRAFT_868944 [Rhizopogon salebrosus TDB-379]|nr:hypothetical protein M405DRAFT_868944 [Rhizopogon salebrosus TDB-379]